MQNKYVSFITDEDLLECVGFLYEKYREALKEKDIKDFFHNRIDPVKFLFDSTILNIDMKKYLENELLRQTDKTISNAIGTFQEKLIGKIEGCCNLSVGQDIDIVCEGRNLIAEIKNKHNTLKGENKKDLFSKIKEQLRERNVETGYYVRIIDQTSKNEEWKFTHKNEEYSDPNVKIISGDQFYYLLTEDKKAFAKLYKALPIALRDYINSLKENEKIKPSEVTVIEQLATLINGNQVRLGKDENKKLLEGITKINFENYLGFEAIKGKKKKKKAKGKKKEEESKKRKKVK
ncbi:Eco47II family restriction endonuclease [Paenibacillus sp. ACRSA]|uniref:Eco47II family restriction endonuclease n=1 Tax=Paenibacillus sp. ACRSA TaxID=2918211 RepID=UPI001EF66D12|nr:Eco47II family restriction endonuclease [Paenibacillus sp. ACRSA]MCG7377932.1 Eco47II family restriction endonuclease [Paenibacillus sp. ACRSA]